MHACTACLCAEVIEVNCSCNRLLQLSTTVVHYCVADVVVSVCWRLVTDWGVRVIVMLLCRGGTGTQQTTYRENKSQLHMWVPQTVVYKACTRTCYSCCCK